MCMYREAALEPFTPGAVNRYTIRYITPQPEGQRWGFWVNGVWRASWPYTWLIDGWTYVGGERTTGGGGTVWCSGNAEFTGCKKFRSNSWSYWTDPRDWRSTLYDPYFKFYRTSSNSGMIRPR